MDNPQANYPKNRGITAFFAFLGAIQPTPLPFAGIHKLYLGQYGWGLVYLLLAATPLPRIACLAEGIWYLTGPQVQTLWAKLGGQLGGSLNQPTTASVDETVEGIANSLREIEHLRQEGLMSDYEFEQKRRSLLEQIP